MAPIHWLANRGMLGPLSHRIAKATETPMCGTCQYGKQTRRPIGTVHGEMRPAKEGGITYDKLEP
eukprot:scaffold5750_cov67-Cylindrotheca_fusiformis.AAC.1